MSGFLLENTTVLLQNVTVFTKCENFITKLDSYYKMRGLLQIATVHASSEYLFLRSWFIIYVKWESIIIAEALISFIGIRTGPVALFGFNFLIILLIFYGWFYL